MNAFLHRSYGRHIFAWIAGPVLMGCGGSVADGGGGSRGGNSAGPCTIQAGTYTQHFTTEPGGTNCSDLPDQTITMSGSTTLSGGGGSGGGSGGPGCTSNVDATTCSMTTDCTIASGSLNTTLAMNINFSGDSASGKESVTLTDATGKLLSSCTYDIAMTRQ